MERSVGVKTHLQTLTCLVLNKQNTFVICDYFYLFIYFIYLLKVFDRSFELRGESRLIWSVMKTGGSAIFLFHFKGTPSQEQQKTIRRR